jgi:hypothetical protein
MDTQLNQPEIYIWGRSASFGIIGLYFCKGTVSGHGMLQNRVASFYNCTIVISLNFPQQIVAPLTDVLVVHNNITEVSGFCQLYP